MIYEGSLIYLCQKWVVDEPVKAVAKKNNRIYIWKVVLFIRLK